MSTTGGGSMDEQGRGDVEELTLDAPTTVRSNRPRALWAVLAAVGLAAGGVVVSSANDDGDQRPGLPVDLASATRSGGGDAEAAADAMLAWVEYVPGDDLPALGGEGTAYRLSGEVDEGRVRALADALGLQGDVQSDGAGGWSVVGDGGEGQLRVHEGGGGGWSFFAGYSDCVDADGSIGGCSTDGCVTKGDVTECTISDVGAAVAGAGGEAGCDDIPSCAPTSTTYVPPCDGNASEGTCASEPAATCAGPLPGEEPQPCGPDSVTREVECLDDTSDDADPSSSCAAPTGDLPDEADARAVALQVVAASGIDVDGARVSADSGFDTWYVTVEPELDGSPSGLVSFVEVGPDLHVVSGNGSVGQPVAVGEYPLLDTRGAIARANELTGTYRGVAPAIGEAEDAGASGTTTGGGETGGTDVGGTDDLDAPVSTVVPADDPCPVGEGASDGCGGTTGCGGDGCVEPPTTVPCPVQPDSSEICVVDCPQYLPPEGTTTDGVALGTPESVDCTPPLPLPEPTPLEIVLVDAERSLVLLPANDGSGDAYLVPAYRFTAEDGGTVDLPAVADQALTGSVTTETTVPDTVEPAPVPIPEPQPCEILEEQGPDGESATTITVQTCPPPNEDALVIGEPYYVDIDVECGGGSFPLGGRIWITDDDEVAGWADPGERHEGGMFTLDAEDHGTFVGDEAGTLTAAFRPLGPAEDIFCTPEPR